MKSGILREVTGHAAWHRQAMRIAGVACIFVSTFSAIAENPIVHVPAGYERDKPPCRVWTMNWASINNDMLDLGSISEQKKAVGDIDDDGYDDFAFYLWQRTRDSAVPPVWTEMANTILISYGGPHRRGTYNYVRGGHPASDETHLVDVRGDVIDLETPGYATSQTLPSKLGSLIASDDFDQDGIDDIVFSANSRDPEKNITELCIYYGDPSNRGKLLHFEDSEDCPTLSRILLDDPSYVSDIYVAHSTCPSPLGDVVDWGYPYGFGDICTGDFNADALPDIAVVAFRNWNTPEVVIIYGEQDFRGATRAMSVQGDLTMTKVLCESRYVGNTASLSNLPNNGPYLRLARGDLNGDGIDDLIIGDRTVDPDDVDFQFPWSNFRWPLEDFGVFGQPVGCTGATYILSGSRDLPGTTVDLGTPTPESGETIIRGEGFPNLLGFSLAVGDVNQDGYDELLVGGVTDARWIEQGHVLMYQFPGSASRVGVPWGNGSLVDLKPAFAPIGTWGESRIAFPPLQSDNDAVSSRSSDGSKISESLSPHVIWSDGIGYGDASGDGRDDFMHWAFAPNPPDVSNARGYVRVFSVAATPDIAPGQRAFPIGLLDGRQLGPYYLQIDGFHAPLDSTLPSQDVDGDGNVDIDPLGIRSVLTVFGEEGAPTAMAVERYTSGKTAMRGFGGRLSPVLRAYVGFEDGEASSATVTLNKSRAGISNFPSGNSLPIDCFWRVQTDRAGFTQANLSFHYIENDLAFPPEVPLTLFSAPSPSGPWTPVANQQLNTFGRRIDAQVSELGYFAMAAEDGADTSVGPTVYEIACDACDETEDVAGEDVMTVTFTHPVTGVDESDFATAAPSTVGGGILGVEGSGKKYKVRVALGRGVGSARFEVLDDDSIRDARDLPLGGPGEGNGAAASSTCASVADPVLVDKIVRVDPTPTSRARVSYTVHFTMPVTGVDANDFELKTSGLQDSYIESVEGSGTEFQVQIQSGTGVGTLRLKLIDDDSVLDPGGGPLGGAGLINGDFLGPAYKIEREPDLIPPSVYGITRASVNPTSAASVDFYVSFTEDVVGVDISDLEIVTTGGVSDVAITEIRDFAVVNVVTDSTGTGDGTIQLRLHDDDSIVDLAGNHLGGFGVGNGDHLNGHVYSIYKSDPSALPPVVDSITRLDVSPTDSFSVRYRVRFSESVTGVDIDDIATSTQGLFGSSVTTVSGSGDDYTVSVDTGNGAGTVRLDVRDNDSILDTDGNPLGGSGNDNGHYTNGEYYQIVRDVEMDLRSLKKKVEATPGGSIKVNWTSGAIGKHVRIELWRNGHRVAVLLKKTMNDGSQKVTIPNGVKLGSGYTIRLVSISDPSHSADMRKSFTVQ